MCARLCCGLRGSAAQLGGSALLRQLATRGAATQRGGHGGVAPWLGSARRRSAAAPRRRGAAARRRSARRRGGVMTWRRNGLLGLPIPRAATWPRGGSAARRAAPVAARRRGAASTAPRGFVVLKFLVPRAWLIKPKTSTPSAANQRPQQTAWLVGLVTQINNARGKVPGDGEGEYQAGRS